MPPIVIKNLKIEKVDGKKVFHIGETLKHAEWTTENIPLSLVQNIMDLHNESNPGAVKQFTTSFLKLGHGDKFIKDVLIPSEPSLNTSDPHQTMLAFYKYSFLHNDEANAFIAYSLDGKLLGSALIGNFSRDAPACSISSLSFSPKASAQLHNFMLADLTKECTKMGMEPTLLADSSHSK